MNTPENSRERCWVAPRLCELAHGRVGDCLGSSVKLLRHPNLTAIIQLFQAFLVSTILLGILLVFLVYANVVLLIYHPPTRERFVCDIMSPIH